jgi:hypothetical protein
MNYFEEVLGIRSDSSCNYKALTPQVMYVISHIILGGGQLASNACILHLGLNSQTDKSRSMFYIWLLSYQMQEHRKSLGKIRWVKEQWQSLSSVQGVYIREIINKKRRPWNEERRASSAGCLTPKKISWLAGMISAYSCMPQKGRRYSCRQSLSLLSQISLLSKDNETGSDQGCLRNFLHHSITC